jgi:hypothetical protein
VGDVAPDSFLGLAVVDRGVDEIYAGIKDTVEEKFSLFLGSVAARSLVTEFHRAVAECGDEEACAAELSRW